MLESVFQSEVKAELEDRLPGCTVLVKPGYYIQGFPDLLILFGRHWAVLEVKRSETSPYEPNQEWYLEQLNDMSFSATIYPENMEEVLDAVCRALRARRPSRVPERI